MCAPLYRLATIKMKSSGMPRKPKVRSSCKWSAEGKAWVKSRYAIRMSLLCVWAFSTAETQVGDGSISESTWPEAILFQPNDFVCFYVINY